MSKWKPEIGETYFKPYLMFFEVDCVTGVWAGEPIERDWYKAGFVCRTKEEALELARKMLAVANDKPLTAHRHVYDNGRIKCPKCSKQFVWGYYDSEAYDEIHYCPYCGQRINIVDTEE